MVVAEISIVPVGTGETSTTGYVATAVQELEAAGLSATLGPMGTTVEAQSYEQLQNAVSRAREAVFEAGAQRVYIVLKIDERRDAQTGSAEEKVSSVRQRLSGE